MVKVSRRGELLSTLPGVAFGIVRSYFRHCLEPLRALSRVAREHVRSYCFPLTIQRYYIWGRRCPPLSTFQHFFSKKSSFFKNFSLRETGDVLFEKNQKVMSFLLAPKKELKKTSTPLNLSPIWESSNSDLQKPQILLCFGIAGRRDEF